MMSATQATSDEVMVAADVAIAAQLAAGQRLGVQLLKRQEVPLLRVGGAVAGVVAKHRFGFAGF